MKDTDRELSTYFKKKNLLSLIKTASDFSIKPSPDLNIWTELTRRFLTSLSLLPESQKISYLPEPSPEDCLKLISEFPGNTQEDILEFWKHLSDFAAAGVYTAGGIRDFLKSTSPEYSRSGCVFLHLTDSPENCTLPFYLMTTFTEGFDSNGNLKHIPVFRAVSRYAENSYHILEKMMRDNIFPALYENSTLKKMSDEHILYFPHQISAATAEKLIRNIRSIESCGIICQISGSLSKLHTPVLTVTVGNTLNTGNSGAIFDVDCCVTINGKELSELETSELLQEKSGLVLYKKQWIMFEKEDLEKSIQQWNTVKSSGSLSFNDGMRFLYSSNLSGNKISSASVKAGAGLARALEQMRGNSRQEQNFGDFLRPYQNQGVSWLQFLTDLGLGACLADDMGLGKTVQVLALISTLKKRPEYRPGSFLLIIPSSLISNWKNETLQFAKELRLLFLHPAETAKNALNQISQNQDNPYTACADLIITTYSMLSRQNWITDKQWKLVILDEAQNIRNHNTVQSRLVRTLKSDARIALTGTPVENSTSDLWTLFDFLNPGLLGNLSAFRSTFSTKSDPQKNLSVLSRLISPYVLRRQKTDRSIISDLPDKTEMKVYCGLSPVQIRHYSRISDHLKTELFQSSGISRKGLVLKTILQLKQLCNHPDQLTGSAVYESRLSGKFQRLFEICSEIRENQEKVLVFTQFREIIPYLFSFLKQIFCKDGLILHGGIPVSSREKIISRFQHRNGPPYFVISLKTGGTGLNLTEASHVIHFDRWWNPAVENQATDRAFRIGQHRNVVVHKFICRGTVEEKIDRMISDKNEISTEIFRTTAEISLTELSDEELLKLISIDISAASL